MKTVQSPILLVLFLVLYPDLTAAGQSDLLDMDIEELGKIKVTSVAKKLQSLNDAPAAVYVINNEDIKRSGATSIPDALRLAPGLDVARIDANKWAVSSRGFNGRFSNKLQVLIDGRSVYTRTFAGVFWENQDVMMEDIDRIEVIRGPGATLWGANAVNGVINIITKHSSETQGGLLNVGGGTEEQGFGSFRYGTKLGKDTSARAYIKGFNRDNNLHSDGSNAEDAWDKVQGGFRMDSEWTKNDALTFQGDIYHANINQSATYPQIMPPFTTTQSSNIGRYGGNVLGRWQHTFSPASDYYLQFYYDTYTRKDGDFNESRDTLDLDFQHRFALLDWQEIIWGLNYRFGHDRLVGKPIQNGSIIFASQPESVNDQVFSGFVQDELSLIEDRLWLTVGSKFEHNDYSGFEGQPSAKIMWAPHHRHRLWAGVSRAVRTPSRFEQDFETLVAVIPPQDFLPVPISLQLQGNPGYRSEEVIAYEAGYRTSLSKAVSLDVTGFYNDYRDLRFVRQGAPQFGAGSLILPLAFTNELQGKTYGVEVVGVWQMLDWWRWDANYSWLRTELDASNAMAGEARTGISPEQRVSVRGALSPWRDIDLDFWFRYVDSSFAVVNSGDVNIKPYVTLDLRMAWRPVKNLELALVGQNLLAEKHLEYVQEINTSPTAIDRGLYGKISWGF